MTGQYNINLSNGTVLAPLYPLETNGPNNRSTPRFISRTKPTFGIIGVPVLSPNGVLKFNGDVAEYFPTGLSFDIIGSTGNNGSYVIANANVPGSVPSTNGSWYDITNDVTYIVLTTPLPNPTPIGYVVINAFVLSGDLTYRFVPGFQFDVQNSAGNINDGVYVVGGFGSYVTNMSTVIPVTVSIPNNTSVPLGQIQYAVNDPRTSLVLPGKGTINYGESIIENIVRLTEHFAGDVSPELNTNIGTNPAAQPLKGQLWYKTLTGQEGFKYFDGIQWTSNLNVDDGSLKFKDPENSNTNIYITASEANLPGGPWPGTPRQGLVVWPTTSPVNNTPIFRVLSANGDERFVVEHNSITNAGYLRTINNLDIRSTGDSYFWGRVGIGHNVLPVLDQTLTVQGDGIAINSLAASALLTLNAPTTFASLINFEIANTKYAEIHVNDSNPLHPLEINPTSVGNVTIARGNGKVGIRMVPTYDFDVSGQARFNNPVGINNAPPPGTPVWLEVTGDIQANSQFRGSVQSVAAPTYAFVGNLSTGMFFNNGVAISSVGSLVATFNATNIVSQVPISAPNGSVTNPSFGFSSNINSGMYLDGGTDLSFSVNGNKQLAVSSNNITSAVPIRSPNGSVTSPSYSFVNSVTTGMFFNGTTLGMSVGGTEILTLNPDRTLSVPAGVPAYELLVTSDNILPNKKYVDDADLNMLRKSVRKNYLTNGNFDIWQRGNVVAGTTGFYSADRWRGNSATSFSVTQQTFAPGQTVVPDEPTYYLTVGSGASAKSISQRIESVRTLAGKTVTLTVHMNANTNSNVSACFNQNFGSGGSTQVSGIGETTLSITTGFQKFTITTTIPSIVGKTLGANSYLEFQIGGSVAAIPASTILNIASAQLEEGDVSTDFEYRSIGEEFINCERYFQKEILNQAHQAVFFNPVKQFWINIKLRHQMASPPTIIPGTIQYRWANATHLDASFVGVGGNSSAVDVTYTLPQTSGVDGDSTIAFFSGWSADAEL